VDLEKVREFITRQLETITESSSVQEAARKMSDHSVSSLVVVNDQGKAIGIVTERDLSSKVCIGERNARTTTVKEVMSFPLITVDSQAHPSVAIDIMLQNNVRHLLVVDNNDIKQTFGMITPLDFARYGMKKGSTDDETDRDVIDKIQKILEYYR
jgi:signal-transduction protein with cAMP-binding, CBS, and nucleotidyltransferase domain